MDFCLQKAWEAADFATRGMTAEQLAWRAGEKWSTAEILEHLTLAFSSTGLAMNRCLQEGPPSGAPTLRERAIIAAVVEIGFFPTGRPAPKWTVPQGNDPAHAVEKFRQALEAMDGKIAECEGKFGGGVVAVHPIIGPLTARQWRRFHWVHTRHHMKQIAALRQKMAQDKHRRATA
ncbi:MAG: DinB family protein [Terriglobales bacterium]